LQQVESLAATLLQDGNSVGGGWFSDELQLHAAVKRAFQAALSYLTQRLGPDIAQWTWGQVCPPD